MELNLLDEGNESFSAYSVGKKGEEFGLRRVLPFDFDVVGKTRDHGDPMEVIKRTMIQQENMFQHQILELHSLYWAHKNLMKGFCNSNALLKDSTCNANPYIRETETNLLLQRQGGTSELQTTHHTLHKRHPNLLKFVQTVDKLNKIFGYKGSTGHQSSNADIIDLETMDLNLCARENSKIENAGSYLSPKINDPNRFDLNVAIENTENEEIAVFSSSSIKTAMLCSEVTYESLLPALSDETSCKINKYVCCAIPAKLPDAGRNKIFGIQLSTELPTTRKLTSRRAPHLDFDLNVVQLEETGASFDDPRFISSSESAGSSANSNGSTNESCFSTHQAPTLVRQTTIEQADTHRTDSVSMNVKGHDDHFKDLLTWNNFEGSLESKKTSSVTCSDSRDTSVQYHSVGSIESQNNGLSSGSKIMEKSPNGCLSMLTSPCNDFKDTISLFEPTIGDTRMVHTGTKADLICQSSLVNTNLSGNLLGDSTAERSEEAAFSSSTHGDHKLDIDQLSVGRNSRDITRTNSCSMTCQELPEPPLLLISEDHKCKQIDQVTGISDAPYLQVNQRNPETDAHKESRKAQEIDCNVRFAAESLVHIFVEDSGKQFMPCDRAGQTKTGDVIALEQPQSSSDSLEEIVLTLTDIKMDECSSPTWPTKEAVKNNTCRFRTRSGRRLHDFQKDILPGLVSLSRHEICEDLHAFTEIVKTDELSKGFGKAFRGSFGSISKNRRSRLYSTRRRL